MDNKENQSTLCVPAAAWHALHLRLDDLQAQHSKLQAQHAETNRFLRSFLKLEYRRRERASTRLQAVARGMIARRRHRLPIKRRPLEHSLRSFTGPEQLHVSSVAGTQRRQILSLEIRSCLRLQAAARGHIVRSRRAALVRRSKAASIITSVTVGWLTRKRHGAALELHRHSLRIAALTVELQQERRTRKAQEAALRKLWQDVATLSQIVLPAAEQHSSARVGEAATTIQGA